MAHAVEVTAVALAGAEVSRLRIVRVVPRTEFVAGAVRRVAVLDTGGRTNRLACAKEQADGHPEEQTDTQCARSTHTDLLV